MTDDGCNTDDLAIYLHCRPQFAPVWARFVFILQRNNRSFAIVFLSCPRRLVQAKFFNDLQIRKNCQKFCAVREFFVISEALTKRFESRLWAVTMFHLEDLQSQYFDFGMRGCHFFVDAQQPGVKQVSVPNPVGGAEALPERFVLWIHLHIVGGVEVLLERGMACDVVILKMSGLRRNTPSGVR